MDVPIQIDIPNAVAENDAALRDMRVNPMVVITVEVAAEIDVAL